MSTDHALPAPFAGAAPDPQREHDGLLRALEQLERLMASIERSLEDEARAPTPVPGALQRDARAAASR